jgi:hypothetical protein
VRYGASRAEIAAELGVSPQMFAADLPVRMKARRKTRGQEIRGLHHSELQAESCWSAATR